MMWGGEDLAADIGSLANRDAAGVYTAPYQLARALCLAGAAAAGVGAVDSVYTDFRDAAGLAAEAGLGVRDGFSGKAAIHPDQIAPVNAAYQPSAEELARAERIVAAFRQAEARGEAAVQVDGQMVDYPVAYRAQALLDAARTRS